MSLRFRLLFLSKISNFRMYERFGILLVPRSSKRDPVEETPYRTLQNQRKHDPCRGNALSEVSKSMKKRPLSVSEVMSWPVMTGGVMDVMTCYVRSSHAMTCNDRSGRLLEPLKAFGVFWRLLEPSRCFWSVLKHSGGFWSLLKPSGDF